MANFVEEVLRYASTVMHFRRTATRDVEVAGQTIAKGEKLVMWYGSGNRDEAMFPDASRFDILRDNAKLHQAFGAGGPHFCIGASLARSMLRVAFTEIFTRMPDIAVDGGIDYQVNNFIHGIRSLPVKWTTL